MIERRRVMFDRVAVCVLAAMTLAAASPLAAQDDGGFAERERALARELAEQQGEQTEQEGRQAEQRGRQAEQQSRQAEQQSRQVQQQGQQAAQQRERAVEQAERQRSLARDFE